MEVVAAWLDAYRVCWFHPPNESKRKVQAHVKLKRQGLKPGVPDIIIIDPPPKATGFVGTVIELKAPRVASRAPVTSAAQRRWLDEFTRRGWAAFVAEGARDAIALLMGLGYHLKR